MNTYEVTATRKAYEETVITVEAKDADDAVDKAYDYLNYNSVDWEVMDADIEIDDFGSVVCISEDDEDEE